MMEKQYYDRDGRLVNAVKFLDNAHYRYELDEGDRVVALCADCRDIWPCAVRQAIDSYDALLAAVEAALEELRYVYAEDPRGVKEQLHKATEGAKS